ncbi:MAG: hypothetical protein KDC18_11505 [Alphaproteobacteria bacterium]|nr:hypothetical protein [Alphaproteobacteria bacterium]MCB9928750.1 hypothetical protein [Alphaproteobacteria bacterium]
MNDADHLLRLLAMTESVLNRETETLLAGGLPDAALCQRKLHLVTQLEPQIPEAPRLAAGMGADERRQLRTGFERLLQAATRNEAVLRGAMCGSRLLVHAMRQATEDYPGRAAGGAPDAGTAGQVNRIA